MRRTPALVSPSMEQNRDLTPGKQGSPISIRCERHPRWQVCGVSKQVEKTTDGAITAGPGMPRSFPADGKGRGSKHVSEKEASSEENTPVAYRGDVSFPSPQSRRPACPPADSPPRPTLHPGLPQRFLREEKAFQTADWLNSPKTWV